MWFIMIQEWVFFESLVFPVLYLVMISIDAEQMASGLNHIVENESTQCFSTTCI